MASSSSPLMKGLFQRCPACGNGKLFTGILTVCNQCSACHMDLSARDPGDGPAFFVITIMGLVVVLTALAVNAAYHPPLWVHALLWIPFTLAGSIYLLRVSKSLLIAYQYHLKIGF